MKISSFRAELKKLMPGYNWTVHKSRVPEEFISATGIQSSGMNRMSTLYVERREYEGDVIYTAKSSGFGTHAAWLSEHDSTTLAKALRGLQNHYESTATKFRVHAEAMAKGRQSADENANVDEDGALPDIPLPRSPWSETPWFVIQAPDGRYCIANTVDGQEGSFITGSEQVTQTLDDASRIVDSVNAMHGIEHPLEWASKARNKFYEADQLNKRLLKLRSVLSSLDRYESHEISRIVAEAIRLDDLAANATSFLRE